MGYFDLPTGELELHMDGKWESVMFTDRPSKNEIMECVEMWSENHDVKAARFNSHTLGKNETPVIYWLRDDVDIWSLKC